MSEISKELKAMACAASARAYTPYSNFPVGAVAEDGAGRAFSGCNVESAAFGLTQCAERNALNNAIVSGAEPGSLAVLVIYTPGEFACPPCGACRQVICELMSAQARVYSVCDSEHQLQWSPAGLLPDAFEPSRLIK